MVLALRGTTVVARLIMLLAGLERVQGDTEATNLVAAATTKATTAAAETVMTTLPLMATARVAA